MILIWITKNSKYHNFQKSGSQNARYNNASSILELNTERLDFSTLRYIIEHYHSPMWVRIEHRIGQEGDTMFCFRGIAKINPVSQLETWIDLMENRFMFQLFSIRNAICMNYTLWLWVHDYGIMVEVGHKVFVWIIPFQ